MKTESCLKGIGVFGFEEFEPIIMAGLVTGAPLLLVGNSGTGKTFLLNSLSEAMGLEHRHYNASLVSFDDLVGFPYPMPDFLSVKYLETPATIWKAESVLIDEISRCKPEHQNRFFSMIQERRIQGIKLEKLRYCWAAMNPCYLDQGLPDSYEGSEPLDQALADRFAFIIQVPDWNELEEANQRAIADPRGEGLLSDDNGKIRSLVEGWSRTYQGLVQDPPQKVIEYCRVAATVLNETKIRISPRRVRQLVRNILGVLAVSGGEIEEKKLLLTLRWSLPHRAWGVIPKEEHIKAAHRVAWDAFFLKGREEWLHDFHLRRGLADKVKKLINDCPDPDTGTLAVTQLLASESKERAAAFAFATYPLALKRKLPIGREGINELGKLAKNLMEVFGEIEWQEQQRSDNNTEHPEKSRFSKVLEKLSGSRRERATQLFSYLLINKISLSNPETYEKEFERCISLLRKRLRT